MTDSNPQTPDRESRIDDLVDEFVRRSRSGDSVAAEDLVAANPDLQPELLQRLTFAKSLVQVISKTDAEVTTHAPHGGQVERLRCPHCGNIVQVVSEETSCGSCGSHIDPDGEGTTIVRRTRAEIGHFQLLERIGSGGFGIVYRAIDTDLQRPVAVKVPRRGYFGSLDEEARFLREARHAATLRHPNIVQVFEVGTDSGSHFIATEFIEGLDLAEVIRSQLLSFEQTAELLAKIALALDHAHAKNLVHRDVKPANIIVDRDFEPYLADFGLARTAEPAITMTREGEILGTPAYMSPEQARGEHSVVDRRSDVYSLGVTLFRMLSGELPFRGSRRMLLEKVIAEDPPLLRALNDKVPRDLETIALRAMEKAPDKRYQSAKAVAEELQRWLAGDPIQARPISRTERFGRWCRKHPLISTLVGTIAALVLAIAVGSLVWGVRESRLRDVADESDRSSRRSLAGLYASAADQRLDADDSLGSLPYAVETLAVQEGLDDGDAATATRTQIRTTLGTSPRLVGLLAVEQPIKSIVPKPDGTGFLVAMDKAIRQVDVGSGTSEGGTIQPEEQIHRSEYSHDGSRILAAHNANHASLWNADTGQLVAKLQHPAPVLYATFSPNESVCATTGIDGKTVLWSINDGAQQKVFDHGTAFMTVLRFSPDGKILAAWSKALPETSDGQGATNELLLITTSSGETTRIDLGQSIVNRLVFENDSSLLTVLRSGEVRRYSIDGQLDVDFSQQIDQSATQVRKLGQSQIAVVSPSGVSVLATAGSAAPPGPIRHGALIAPSGFTVSPNRTLLAMAGEHDRVNVHWTASGRRVGPALAHGTTVSAVSFLSDHILVAGTANGVVKTWDLSGLTRDTLVLKHPGRVLHGVSAPDSKQVATVSIEEKDGQEIGRSHLWQRDSGRAIGEAVEHQAGATVTAYSHDGTVLVSADFGGGIIVRRLDDPDTPPKILKDDAWITKLAFPAGTNDYFASGNNKGNVRVWRSDQDDPATSFAISGVVKSLQFHPTEDTLVAACSSDGVARVWNTETQEPESALLRSGNEMLWCGFSPDGDTLATADTGGVVTIWDWRQGSKQTILTGVGRQRHFAFSPSGEQLSVANDYSAVQIWNTSSPGAPAWSLPQPRVNTVDWHSARPIVVSAGSPESELKRGHVRLWNARNGRAMSPRLPFSKRAYASFLPDGDAVLAYSDDTTAVIWDITPTTIDTELLRQLSQLLSGSAIRSGRIVALSADEQMTLFSELKGKLPTQFVNSREDLSRWAILRQLAQ